MLGSFVEGDPGLSPERSISLESGARYEGSRATASVVLYDNRLDGYVYLQRTTRTALRDGVPVPVYVNAQTDGRIRGLEMAGSAEIARNTLVTANYSRLRSRNVATREQLPLMPADQARLTVRHTAHGGGRILAPYVETGARHVWAKAIAGITEPFADPELNPLGPGVGSTTAYDVVDLAFGGRLAVAGDALDVHVGVENVFNAAYRDFLDTLKGVALGQGRNVTLRITAPFSILR